MSAHPSAFEAPRARNVWQRVLDRVPGSRVAIRALLNYVGHQSANQAGSVAFSCVLAMFPLMLCLSAAAAFIGEPGAAAALVTRVIEFAPPLVCDALKPVVTQVMSERNRALLTAGLFFTIWTASSGVLSIRTALNNAYGVSRGLPFWLARLKVTGVTIVAAVGAVFVFSSVVVLPYAWELLHRTLGVAAEQPWLRDSVRYGLAFVVIASMYALLYAWLPDRRQRLRTVLPGALIGAVLWLLAAAVLSYTLRSAAKLTLVYGSFAGLVATLVFLYASAATLIYGAEVNAVLRDHGLRHGVDDAHRSRMR